ncbi:hypothetical protein SRABI126_04900 [Pedobacter sp. Bi126]|nr:hypothetical protein SRABI126_04900 [Pedobacter sp. Bi126]
MNIKKESIVGSSSGVQAQNLIIKTIYASYPL